MVVYLWMQPVVTETFMITGFICLHPVFLTLGFSVFSNPTCLQTLNKAFFYWNWKL